MPSSTALSETSSIIISPSEYATLVNTALAVSIPNLPLFTTINDVSAFAAVCVSNEFTKALVFPSYLTWQS